MKNQCNMPENMEEMGRDIKEIKDALLGNGYNNNQGIIYKVDKHEQKLKNFEGKVAFLVGVSAAISFFMGQVWDKIFK